MYVACDFFDFLSGQELKTCYTERFENPFQAGDRVMLRPEDSMRIQHSIGADIMM